MSFICAGCSSKTMKLCYFSNLLNLPSHGFSVFAINLDFCQNQFIVYYVNWVTLYSIHVDWFFYSYYPVFVVWMLFYLMFFSLFAKCVFSFNKMNLIFLVHFGSCQIFDRFQFLMLMFYVSNFDLTRCYKFKLSYYQKFLTRVKRREF